MHCLKTFLIIILYTFCFHPMLTAQADFSLQEMEQKTYTSKSGQEVQAELGQLEVPENRKNNQSNRIEITFIRLKSTATNPATPVIYLSGGPGSSCTWMAKNPYALENWLPVLAVSDVILVDQRGTGAASQQLTWINDQPMPKDILVSEEKATAHFLGMVPRALASWKENDIDIAGYTSLENAKDLDALRIALELPKISLMGFSYGTHLGQTYLKYFDKNVDKAILIGVEGLGQTFKQPQALDAHFRKISAMVAADPLAGEDVPDLLALYLRVSKKLAAQPIDLSLKNPLSGEDMTIKVGKFGLDFILLRDIGDASDLPIIPRLLYTIDQGDYSIFKWFLQKRISGGYGLQAMAVTMDIASGADPGRKEMIKTQAKNSFFGNVVNTPYMAISEVWPNIDLGAAFRSDFTTTVPVLLLSGTLDFNTPPYQAEQLRWSLPNARHIIVQHAGHEQIQDHPDVVKAIVSFLKGEEIGHISAAHPPLRFMPVQGEVEDMWHPALGEKK